MSKPVSGFSPLIGQTLTTATTQASSSVNFTTLGITASQIRIYNAGPNGAYIRWGTGTQTASTSDMLIPAGAIEVFNKGCNADTIATIAATGQTAVLNITAGEGN